MKRLIAVLLIVTVLFESIAVSANGSGNVAVPASFKAVSASYNSIKLSWSAVTGANGYTVSKYNPSTKKYSTLAETSAINYTVSSLTANVTYTFQVAAYKNINGVKTYGAFTAPVSAKPVPGTPGWVKAASASPKGYTKVSWQAVSGATAYIVYRSASSTKNFTKLKATTATSYTSSGALYYYKVAAYRTVNKVNVYGKTSNVFSTPEISITGLKSKMPGAKILRAWKITDSDTNTSVFVEKLSYGSPIKTTCNNNKYGVNKSYTITQSCFVAIINCKPENFGSASALKTLNKTGIKKGEGLVNDIAKKKDAVIAINNEGFSGHWNAKVPSEFSGTGPVVKDGMLVQNKGGERTCATINKNGTWLRNEKITQSNVGSKINSGLSFTQLSTCVVWDSKRLFTFGSQHDLVGKSTNGLRNRVLFAQIDTTHYIMMVGEFMQSDIMISILIAYGAKKAFYCNGGNCAYLYLRGVGNVTGTAAPQLVSLNKMNVLEQEWLGAHNYLNGGKGAACPAVDIVYAR